MDNHTSSASLQLPIQFLQLNAHKSHVTLNDAVYPTHGHQSPYQILCILEPPSTATAVEQLNQFTSFADFSSSQRPRAAIYVHNCLLSRITFLSHYSDRDMVSVLLRVLHGASLRNIVIVSHYIAPANAGTSQSDVISPHHMQRLSNIYTTHSDIIWCSDTNSHASAWHSNLTDDRGQEVMALLIQNNLHVLNELSVHTTFQRANGSGGSNIDVTACTSSILNVVRDWRLSPAMPLRGDHRPITFSLYSASLTTPTTRTMYNYSHANIEQFNDILRENLDPTACDSLNNRTAVDFAVNNLISSIKTALGQSVPLRAVAHHHVIKFWSTDLYTLRQTARRATDKYRRTPTDENCNLRQQHTATYNAARITARRAALFNHFKKEAARSPYDLYHALTTPSNKKSVDRASVQANGQWLVDNNAKADAFATHFFGSTPVTTPARYSKASHRRFPLVTEQEVRSTILSQPPVKAGGYDGIQARVLHWCVDIIAPRLAAIANACFRLSYFPDCLKTAKVIVLPKPGKSDYSLINSFRPISLLPIVGRVLERLIYERLLYIATTTGCISSKQFGFLPRVSTIDCLDFEVNSYKTVPRKGFCCSLKIDISGAFDNASHKTIISQLRAKNIPPYLAHIIRAYLTNRNSFVNVGDATSGRRIIRGAPQGGCLSPLLWLFVCEKILSIILPPLCTIHAFADDMTVKIEGSNYHELQSKAISVLRAVTDAARTCGLTVNSSKTELLDLSRLQQKDTFQIAFDNTVISASSSVRSLGVHLDSRLTFSQHVDLALRRCEKTLFALRRAACRYGGANQHFFVLLYETVILPMLLYGVEIWCPALQRRATVKKFEKFERLLLLSATGCLRSTPTVALCVLAGVQPIMYYAEIACARREIKLKATKHPLLQSLQVRRKPAARPLYRQAPTFVRRHMFSSRFPQRFVPTMYTTPLQWPPPWQHLTTHAVTIQTKTASLEAEAYICTQSAHDTSIWRIYSDASCVSNRATCAFNIYEGLNCKHKARFNLGPGCTAFQAELQAVALCVRTTITRLRHTTQPVTAIYFFTDSQSVLASIQHRRPQ